MPARVSLRLFKAGAEGRPGAMLCDDARAVDISLGGLRLETGTKIPVNRKLLFVFGEDFTVPRWSGEGVVRWSKQRGSSPEEPMFHAGLAFTDSRTPQAVSRHLGLPI